MLVLNAMMAGYFKRFKSFFCRQGGCCLDESAVRGGGAGSGVHFKEAEWRTAGGGH